MRIIDLRNTALEFRRRVRPRHAGLALGALLFAVSASILGASLFSYFTAEQTVVIPEGSSPFSVGVAPGASDTDMGAPPAAASPPPIDPDGVPSRLVIESIGVDAPVVALGLDLEGIPQVPIEGPLVAWYHFSSLPVDRGNAVFSGHVEWGSAEAAFERLHEIEVGDRVSVTVGDGRVLQYDVVVLFEIDPTDPDALGLMRQTPGNVITLITCGGTWVPDEEQFFGGDYSQRLVVRAIQVEDSTPPGFFGF